MRKLTNFIMGAVIGGLIGAGVALLLAPASGEDLRTDIRERAYTLKDDLADAAQSRRIELEKQLANLRKPKGAVLEEA